MLLKNSLLLLALPLMSLANQPKNFPVLATNQASESIRFIGDDGKFTYYQRRSGELVFSTNYSVSTMLSETAGTMFSIRASSSRKKMLISVDPDFHSFLNPSKNHKIYIANFGQDKPQYIGWGIAPELHLNDSWISYYNVDQKALIARSADNELLQAKINLKINPNPHFRPQIAMSSENQIFYTDSNTNGVPALFLLDRVKQETKLLEKQISHNIRYEFCSNARYIYIGTFPVNDQSVITQIRQIDKSNPQLDKSKIVYEKRAQDVGSMVCDFSEDTLYFVQAQNRDEKFPQHEIAKLTLADGQVKVLTDFKSATNVFSMDGKLLTLHNGQMLVLQGGHNMTQQSVLPKANATTAPAEVKDSASPTTAPAEAKESAKPTTAPTESKEPAKP